METLGIPLVIIMTFIIVLWFLIGARGHWGVKTLVIAIALFSAVGAWKSVDNAKGYETTDPLPIEFQVHWVVVDEPAKGKEGSIRVWLTETELSMKSVRTPNGIIEIPSFVEKSPNRVYRLKYSKKRRDQASKILEMIKAGRIFMGTTKGKGDGIEGKGEKGKGKGKGKSNFKGKGKGNSLSNSDSPMFYELPPPIFPEKERK